MTVDIKSSGGSKETFPDEIDNYMREWFNAGLMYTPGELSPSSDDFVAKDAKLNAFSTDKITGHSWAHIGNTPFVQL